MPRGTMVMMHFGMVRCPPRCGYCRGPVRFVQERAADRASNYRYRWWCNKPDSICNGKIGVSHEGGSLQQFSLRAGSHLFCSSS